MIKINLASKKRSAVAGRGGGKPSVSFDQLGGLLADIKELPLRRMIVPIVVCVVANLLMNSYMDSEVQAVDAELTKVQAEKPRLEAEAAKLKAYEDLKKNIEADEATLRNKLRAIKTLMAGRNDTEQIMQDLSNMIPRNVWLTDFQLSEGGLKLKGLSTDFDPVMDFQKVLNENAHFSDVEAKNTAQDQQRRMVTFDIEGQRKKVSP